MKKWRRPGSPLSFSLSLFFFAKISVYAAAEHCGQFSGNDMGGGGSEKPMAFSVFVVLPPLFLPKFHFTPLGSPATKFQFSKNELEKNNNNNRTVKTSMMFSVFIPRVFYRFFFLPLCLFLANYKLQFTPLWKHIDEVSKNMNEVIRGKDKSLCGFFFLRRQTICRISIATLLPQAKKKKK